MWDNWITLANGKFTNALANNRTLRILDLSCNRLGDEEGKLLAARLKANETLWTIGLNRNQIGNNGGGKAWLVL